MDKSFRGTLSVVALIFFMLFTKPASLLQITESQKLIPDKDMTIWCNASGKSVEWLKDNETFKEDRSRITIEVVEGGTRLTIRGANKSDLGEYTCRIAGSNMRNRTRIYSPPEVVTKWLKSQNVELGAKLTLVCGFSGHPPPTITLYRDDEVLETSDRITVTNEPYTSNATVEIDELTYDDRANYSCAASNDFASVTLSTFIRVKDKLDALWPFLGIVAEVLILVIVIFCYERKRSKGAEDEDDVDATAAPSRSTDSGKGDVRQRK